MAVTRRDFLKFSAATGTAACPGDTMKNLSSKCAEKDERLAEISFFRFFRPEPLGDANRMKIMTKENLLDLHIHLHSHEIISAGRLGHKSNIQAGIFQRFARGLILGIGFIGLLWFQWWR